MPSLWERVDGVSQVLALLPGLDDVNESAVPIQIHDNDFARLNVYASWIKHLEICKNGEFSLSKHQSDMLRQYSAAHILLPNLESITSSNPKGDAEILWVLPFLSASVLRLEFIIINPLQQPNISIPESSIILRTISRKCPKLQTLAILSEWDRSTDSYILEYASDDNEQLDENQLEHLHPFLASIRPLTSLTCSDELLVDHACFQTISSWPSLERLEIALDSARDEYSVPSIPATAFPCLKHLALYWFTPEVFEMFHTPAIFSKLISIKLLPDTDLFRSNEDFSGMLVSLFSRLTKSCPVLQSIWIRVVGVEQTSVRYGISASILSNLQGLPLQTLYMEGITFIDRNVNGQGGSEGFSLAERLATMFPALKELAFPNQSMSFADLRVFHSKMAHLEILRFNFNLTSLPFTNIDIDLNAIEQHRNSPFHTLEANLLGLDARGEAAGIAKLRFYQ
ncbi:hypothetical protein FRC12_022069, partial [Ceratobasidium sp. 428]